VTHQANLALYLQLYELESESQMAGLRRLAWCEEVNCSASGKIWIAAYTFQSQYGISSSSSAYSCWEGSHIDTKALRILRPLMMTVKASSGSDTEWRDLRSQITKDVEHWSGDFL